MKHFKTVALKDAPQGEFVRRLRKDGTMMAKTYKRAEYDRSEGKYALIDCDDYYGAGLYLKGSTLIAIGFTY